MPPKRKRVDPEAEVTSASDVPARATRGSVKTKEEPSNEPISKKSTSKKSKGIKALASRAKAPVGESDEDEVKEAKPVAKKAKTSKAAEKKRGSKSTQKSKPDSKISDNEPLHDDEAGPSKAAPKKLKEAPVKEALASVNTINHGPASVSLTCGANQEPYSPALALSLFNNYVDADTAITEEPVIGPEGFERLCNDAQIPLDGALPLVLAWMLDAKEMAKIRKDEWIKGTSVLQISSLHALGNAIHDAEALLVLDKTPLKRSTSKVGGKSDKEPYNCDLYWTYAADKKAAFLKLYGFCFALAKPPQTRNIEMETATAFWSVLLVPRYPIMTDVVEFINEKGSYKGANKDLWSMMLEFCQTVSPTLDNYEADGAWPTLLDEFVMWKKAKTT